MHAYNIVWVRAQVIIFLHLASGGSLGILPCHRARFQSIQIPEQVSNILDEHPDGIQYALQHVVEPVRLAALFQLGLGEEGGDVEDFDFYFE